jgi:hypothetical protein
MTIFGASPAGARGAHNGAYATRNPNCWPDVRPDGPTGVASTLVGGWWGAEETA